MAGAADGTPGRGDRARAMVTVAVPPDDAFRLFTEQMDLWWRRGRRYRVAPGDRGLMAMEPGEGGRVFESWHDAGGECRVREIGRVTVWEPARRLVFTWRAANFAPGESTEVEVRFSLTAAGHTQVSVEHRGWAAVRPDHPVRHAEEPAAFLRSMALWWGDLLTALRLRAAGRWPGEPPTPPPEPPASPR